MVFSYNPPKSFQLILFLQIIILLINISKADSQPKYVFTICSENGNYTQNSIYRTNLFQVLTNLVDQSSKIGFANSTIGQNPDTVYGMFYCRGDINPLKCRTCVQEAAKRVVNVNCTTQKEAIIWYQECTLRYANTPVTSLDEDDTSIAWSIRSLNVTNLDEFESIVTSTMTDLAQKAAYNGSYKGYATKVAPYPPFDKLYSLVQCTPDILGLPCEKCLLGIVRYWQMYFKGLKKVMLFRPNCQMSYDTIPFYAPPSPPTPPPLPPPPTLPPPPSQKRGAVFYIVRIVVPLAAVLAVTLFIVMYYAYQNRIAKQRKLTEVPPVQPPDGHIQNEAVMRRSNSSQSLQYDLDSIKLATNNFSAQNKLGEGGFGPVYKGRLPDGQDIAVKRLSEDSRQGLKEFTNEVQLLAKLQHRNLVKFLGFCLEGQEKLLIYEFVTNLSLDRFLFDPHKRKYLYWDTRFKIILGIARGLLYLHEDSRVKIIHRDLKSSNILLDDEMNPKIADFGTARLLKIDHTQANTSKIFGTFGYMAPEYAAGGVFSSKSDVYSFGVMVLEIISGQSNNFFAKSLGKQSLISNAWKLWNTGRIMELVDPSVGNNFSRAEVVRSVQVALFCVQEDPSSRPTMESVLLILQNNSSDAQLPPRLSGSSSDINLRGNYQPPDSGEVDNDHLESDLFHERNTVAEFTDLYPR